MLQASQRQQLGSDGCVLLRGVLEAEQCSTIAAACPATPARSGGLRNPFGPPGVRGIPWALKLADIAGGLLDTPAFAVRVILFDKTPGANWVVAWHQDLSIPVRERVDVAGYRGWSLKEGVRHVQAPQQVLDGMLTLRLHLDDCDAGSGPLLVLPGSHALGRLDPDRVQALLAGQRASTTCTARAGDVLAMRPSLLHASGKALQPRRRRVLHIEYAARDLPLPLEWHRV